MMSPWNIGFNVNSYTSRQRDNDVPMEYKIQWNIRFNVNSYTSRQRDNDVPMEYRIQC